jgi:hypothetical protein
LKSKKRNIILGTMDTSTDENLPMIVAGEGAVTRSTWIPARTDRLQTRLRDAILLAIILRMLSAVLRTLTASYSSDTVMLLSSCGMVLHLIACNYMLAHQKVQLEIACNYMLAHQKVQVENSRQSENKLMAENNSLRNEIGRQRSLFEDEQKRNEEIKREKEIMAQEALKQAAELEGAKEENLCAQKDRMELQSKNSELERSLTQALGDLSTWKTEAVHQKVQVENSRQSENKLMAENNSLRNEIGRQRSLFEDEQKRNEEIKREKEIMAQEALKQAAELEQLQRKAEDSDERRLSAERARDMAVKESLEAKEASSKQR